MSRNVVAAGSWICGVIVAAVSVACASETDGSSSDGSRLESDLAGREFRSTSVEGHPFGTGTEINVHFGEDESEIGASSNCNSKFGPYRIVDGTLRVSGLSTTAIGCDAERHAQDEWLADLLTSSPAITFDDPELTITGDAGTIELLDIEIAVPDRPLAGIRWIGNGFSDGDSAWMSASSTYSTLEFDEAGTVAVFTGCQHGTGRYTADADTITFEDLVYDAAECEDPSAASTSETLLSVLDGSPVSYSIDGLDLAVELAGTTAMFRAPE